MVESAVFCFWCANGVRNSRTLSLLAGGDADQTGTDDLLASYLHTLGVMACSKLPRNKIIVRSSIQRTGNNKPPTGGGPKAATTDGSGYFPKGWSDCQIKTLDSC